MNDIIELEITDEEPLEMELKNEDEPLEVDLINGEEYSTGYTEGEAAGYQKGHTEGYTEGETEGFEKGHTEGYTEGIEHRHFLVGKQKDKAGNCECKIAEVQHGCRGLHFGD